MSVEGAGNLAVSTRLKITGEWQVPVSVEGAGNQAVRTRLEIKGNYKRAFPWKVQVIKQ